MIYAMHYATSEWITHFDRGYFAMSVDETNGNPDFVATEDLDDLDTEVVGPGEDGTETAGDDENATD